MIHDAFEHLGLAPDADEKAIRRAYAQRLKTCRPDDDPVAFQRLNDAYQQALHWRHRHAPAATADVPPARDLSAAPAAAPLPQPAPRAANAPGTSPPAPRAAPRVAPESFLRELAVAALRGEPGALRDWLDNHPALWSLPFKQQLGGTLLHELMRQPMPMPATCFDTLMAYFELDQVTRGADGILLGRLREACHQRYAPIGRYLAQRPAEQDVGAPFEPTRFLARLRDLCAASDPGDLWAWLHLQSAPWSPAERQQAGRIALAWLRTEPLPMPRACYASLAEHFGWPDDALGDGAKATQSALADRHLAWLLMPAHTSHLARAVQDPQERYADVPKTRQLRDLLTRPFSWSGTLRRALSLHWPRELADFIFRLRAAAGLEGAQVRLLERHLDARSLRFWSEAGTPGRLTAAKLALWGVRASAALAVEVLICALIGWRMGAEAFGERYLGMVVLATCGLALYATVFHLLLFWQTLPGPHSRVATLCRVLFVPLLCVIVFGASKLPPPHYVSGGVAITACLLALLTYLKRDRANKNYAKLVLLFGGITFATALLEGDLRPGWAAGFALVFWTMDLASADRATAAGR